MPKTKSFVTAGASPRPTEPMTFSHTVRHGSPRASTPTGWRDLLTCLALRSRFAPSLWSGSTTKTNKRMGNSLLRISGTFQENVTLKQNDRKCALWMTARGASPSPVNRLCICSRDERFRSKPPSVREVVRRIVFKRRDGRSPRDVRFAQTLS